MFEDIITQLDSLGVTYTEDYDNSTLVIDIESVDKDVLVEIISALNTAGYMFDIDASSVTVYGSGEISEEPATESYEEDAYLDDALSQM